MYCYKCGSVIDDEAVVCVSCGCATKNMPSGNKSGAASNASNKSRLVAFLLCIFLGLFGVHRFYLGHIATGIIWIFTGGCFGIGWLIDIILIGCGAMKDKKGRKVLLWDNN